MMLKTYFYIPANNEKFVKNAVNITADEIIFDFEDSINENDFEKSLKIVCQNNSNINCFVRPRLFDLKGNLWLAEFSLFIEKGFTKFVLPKLSKSKHLKEIRKVLEIFACNKEKISFILLIENATCLLKLRKFLHKRYLNIVSIGLGSHDYASFIGMEHNPENLYYARFYVLNCAKAFGIEAIDITSMSLSNQDEYNSEIKYAFKLGYDAKFVIHPFQLRSIRVYTYFTSAEIENARKILTRINASDENKALFNIDGVVYERMHIDKLKRILNWSNTYESK